MVFLLFLSLTILYTHSPQHRILRFSVSFVRPHFSGRMIPRAPSSSFLLSLLLPLSSLLSFSLSSFGATKSIIDWEHSAENISSSSTATAPHIECEKEEESSGRRAKAACCVCVCAVRRRREREREGERFCRSLPSGGRQYDQFCVYNNSSNNTSYEVLAFRSSFLVSSSSVCVCVCVESTPKIERSLSSPGLSGPNDRLPISHAPFPPRERRRKMSSPRRRRRRGRVFSGHVE